MTIRRLSIPAAALAISLPIFLSACAQQRDLKPLANQNLPATAIGAQAPPNAAELLQPHPQAAPERSVELRRRSEEREDDAFDLPPPE